MPKIHLLMNEFLRRVVCIWGRVKLCPLGHCLARNNDGECFSQLNVNISTVTGVSHARLDVSVSRVADFERQSRLLNDDSLSLVPKISANTVDNSADKQKLRRRDESLSRREIGSRGM